MRFTSALILPNLTISPLRFLPTAKYSLSRSNSQMTMMASICCFLNWHHFDQNSIIIGLESTAHYGDNLVRFLISKDFKVCVLNPIQGFFHVQK